MTTMRTLPAIISRFAGPAFHALTPDETTYEMLGVKTGTGGLTTTHTAVIYAPDNNNVYQRFGADAPVWSGGREVTNYIKYNNDLENAIWRKLYGCSVNGEEITIGTDQPNARVDQYTTIQVPYSVGVGGNALLVPITGLTAEYKRYVATLTTGLGYKVSFSVELKAGTVDTITLDMYMSSSTQPNCALRRNGTGVGATIFARNTMCEVFPPGSTGIPSEYIDNTSAAIQKIFANQNGNTVTSNVVTEAVGTPLAEMPYLQYYPAATNKIIRSNDLTVASAWNAGSAPYDADLVTSQDQIGITGAPNTATLLEDPTAAKYSIAYQTFAISGTAQNTWKTWIKKDADTSRFPVVRCGFTAQTYTPAGGDPFSYWHINTSTGAIVESDVTGSIVSVAEMIDAGNWWLLCVQAADTTSKGRQTYTIYPAAATTIGVLTTSAIGTCIVGQVEFHEGKTIAKVRGLGPMFTTTAEVTTDAPVYSFNVANDNNSAAAYYVEHVMQGGYLSGFQRFLGTSTTGQLYLIPSPTGGLRSYNGVEVASFTKAYEADVLWKEAVSYFLNENINININNVWGTPTGAMTVVYPQTLGYITLPRTDFISPMKLRNIQRYDITSYQNGQTIIDDLMINYLTGDSFTDFLTDGSGNSLTV